MKKTILPVYRVCQAINVTDPDQKYSHQENTKLVSPEIIVFNRKAGIPLAHLQSL